ncbi:hypothetical protein C8A03DRAFT_13347 [Achaetomium macrosporum]|uniref:Uncharacterized protein n=1 Tax=Achaetomium macrosporum TaxID=79813 RepID=A0AAN7HH65_9PEZI|nr:hypothetical protein C8A03DRAFT_13347 [Achaetomium macrosporum]
MSVSTSTSTPSTTGTSFRHRLQKLQTQHLPPPPWSGGGSASAISPQQPRSAISVEPRSAVSHHEPRSATRPPLSPRRLSAAAVTGQSRFVEGSMNDRVSAAPPPGFLGFDDEDEDDVKAAFGWDSNNNASRARAGSHTVGGTGLGGRQHLRRPRSTAVTMQEHHQHQQRGSNGGGGVTKRSSFLAPLWDGVREKLHLSRSKSSGSIGRVVNSVVGGGGKLLGEKEREEHKVAATPTVGAGYPSREEVLESYKNLVASGFFEAHAIRGGRHPGPLRTAGDESGQGPVAVLPSPTGRSFADHMAAAQQQQQQQQHPVQPACTLSSPTRSSMGPPVLPPRGSPQRKLNTMYETSPRRGTKRGASIDATGDTDFSPRKLVKKLRHSASRISMELTGMMDTHLYHSYATVKSRPSTSSYPPGPLSPTFSIFSTITSPPPVRTSFSEKTASSIRHGSLTKAKDGRRRRILGLTRRHRSPAPAVASTEADPDAMMIDKPEPQPQPQIQQSTAQLPGSTRSSVEQQRKVPRILTPPPAAFRSHPPPPRLRTSSTSSSVASVQHVEHEPLSIVPDPNQGIPFVPRIPREFCDAMSAMVPPATEVMTMGNGGGADPKTKNVNRDSGLGEDVENMAIWG